ncbi:MAG: biopolymer transporter ExbD [candidate division KSB1 bacterium]|nr:biopolymer transporter ExbD [candidate division KSB1 bacterium]MDZ7333524.1 biopolymer transporter ExbD [candidate division KSB1 bacterium]MDZ7356728.1 biopolymer transporter ExbD [candidate division KSB1 bacterium]MDZ7375688.1 biopolymer transporter ExbD [candidate division KSB1 bacterium]MDZ7398638.1 biopolymer transporter ExbD [candidate division KSB1 bacterium]
MEMQPNSTFSFQPLSIKGRKKTTHFALKLTSMIDMFTILLVFLLKNFSAEGQIMSVAPDLRLPESTAQKPPETASIIAVTNDFVLLDGKRIARINEVVNSDKLLIPELMTELEKKRRLSEKVGEIHSQMGFTGKISIQGDRELPYLVIKKIMFTCGQVGFNEMMLAVSKPD